ncbi:MAG: diguanylate cyclase [Moorea sp. SIO2B7]|nr:diguanylate cyclase [Moorena sp. SIO2B7]
MTVDEALAIVDKILEPKRLTQTQQLVFCQSWSGKTYLDIAFDAGYDPDYIKEVGSQLWNSLSKVLGEKVTKKNMQSVLRNYQSAKKGHKQDLSSSEAELEFPSGVVSINSAFYIERPPIEERTYTEISKPGRSLIRIKAPSKMGKTSLMHRILAHGQEIGLRTAILSFQRADSSVFTSLDKFLRWFCANVSRQLKLKPLLDDYWDEDIGSKVSCTLYFQEYLLEEIDSPIVLALDEVNRIFEYPDISGDFLPLLRSWYEDANELEIWQKLRLVVVHATEVYIPLNLNQSPFNVGLPIKLPEFSLEQVQDLAKLYGLEWANASEAEELMAMVGGHPYLVRLALYRLAIREITLEQLLQEAPTLAGIYSDHLRQYLTKLQEYPELAAALKQVVNSSGSVRLEAIAAYKLESMGLVKLNGDQVTPSCELYRLYFSSQLLEEEKSSDRLEQLEQENQKLQQLANTDSLTQVANRRYFDEYLQLQWQWLSTQPAPLSLIFGDVDFFKAYNDTYGHQKGDACLQQLATAISNCANRPTDLVARYGGEEFGVILPNTDAQGAVKVAQLIRKSVKALGIPHDDSKIDLDPILVSISLGVATIIPNSQSSPESLIAAADEALYQSKAQGRDCVTLKSLLKK